MSEQRTSVGPGVHVERNGPVLVVTIDRQDVRNAVDGPTASALDAAFDRLDHDDDLAAAVLTGAGGTFCAGADLHALTEEDRRNRLEETLDGPMGPTRRRTRKPTIAAVEGYAVAGGLELALWCDLRVAAEGATFGVFCRRWGVPLIDGGTVRLPRVVGLGVALDLILTGRPVDAEEALRIGLANRVVPTGTARDAAVALGTLLAGFPRETMLADLDAARRAFDAPLDEALLAEHRSGTAALLAGGAADVVRFQAGDGRGGRFEAPPL
ncbi:crotonase/enoyl-CoA hydratase family protein [Nitriliruptor alkaliphilus]|uniref:crotonase/enoyl-CoA hydratase family protein n=1 Tax=Nitriliruptor alkaliphilus TaxID=427918 RepID=UPI0006991E3E|nr:crotonase/enoyl-CoA hydratase family protein [Nitriliruptor alkaliphilus]